MQQIGPDQDAFFTTWADKVLPHFTWRSSHTSADYIPLRLLAMIVSLEPIILGERAE